MIPNLGIANQGDIASVPRYFYKFRSLATRLDRERAVDICRRKRVYFASPESFNDPFDCAPFISHEYTRADFINGWSNTALILGNASHIGEALQQAMAEWEARSDPVITKQRNELASAKIIEQFRRSGVFCMNTNPWNPLVWAHYADCHRGVAFQFSVHPGSQHRLGICMEVDYSATRTPIRILEMNPYRILEVSLFQKALDWQYEHEWRCVLRNQIGHIEFNPSTLTGIVIGARVSARVKHLIRRAVDRWLPDTIVYEARLATETFDIEIPSLPTDEHAQCVTKSRPNNSESSEDSKMRRRKIIL